MRKVVFVAGAHGAGKGHFCTNLAPHINANHVAASSLIRNRKNLGDAKAISGIGQNQAILVEELRSFESHQPVVLLDGHFCLYDQRFNIEFLPSELFQALAINYIIVLTCDPDEILSRLYDRDDQKSGLSIEHVERLQTAEREHARCVSNTLGTQLVEIDVTTELQQSSLSDLAANIRESIGI